MTTKQPKITVWLSRNGFKAATTQEELRNPEVLYEVQRTQNTTSPRIGDRLDENNIQSLIDQGLTINLS